MSNNLKYILLAEQYLGKRYMPEIARVMERNHQFEPWMIN